MCSIVCAFNSHVNLTSMRPQLLEMSKKLRHRGPDWSGIYSEDNAILVHERLSIVDPVSGKQPLFSENLDKVLAVNGEIYNHLDLRKEFKDKYNFKTQSDCEVILALYNKYGSSFMNKLNGIFAFTLYDAIKDEYLIARDHIGVVPLYLGWDKNNTLFVASEMKALEDSCKRVEIFPPGHFLTNKSEKPQLWYKSNWNRISFLKDRSAVKTNLKEALEKAVHRQLMTDVPYGVLLSGGLDSSLIAAITKKFSNKRIEENDSKDAWWPQLHSFSVGLKGSPDLNAARIVANHINTVHHEVTFTIQEGLDAIRDVIYSLETYDVTTIRAATPMYLMARVIKSMGIKMVLSGEGADEIFGGYLYFHKAPNSKEFHEETVRKLKDLHLYDCLRANKSMAAWGVEARVPFLDKEFLEVAMKIEPKLKMINHKKIEKLILREAFENYLPEEILFRQKEQFSDGVGYDWIDTLKALAEKRVTDDQFENASSVFTTNTPLSKEEYHYRKIFNEFFPSDSAALTVPSKPSVACSSEIALKWDKSFDNLNDPSGRAVSAVHENSN